MGGMRRRTTLVAVAALAASALAGTQVAAAPSEPRPNKDDRATDCVSRVTPGKGSRVRITLWCGVQEGKIKFTIRRQDKAPLGRFSSHPRDFGPGLARGFECHRHGPAIAVCRGYKDGPLTVRAWLASPGEKACEVSLHITLPHLLYGGTPFGCRPRERESAPRFGPTLSWRREFGLDPDLAGDADAIAARVRALIAAWHRGEPAARYTYSSWGVAMLARDQRELEARETWIAILGDNIYRWVHGQRLGRVFADHYLDHEGGGVFHVGFTEDQDALVAAVERRFSQIPADRIAPFPFQPRHSIAALGRIEIEIAEDDSLWKVLTSVGVNVEHNVVEVGSQHVVEARRLLAERFGAEAPISVVYEEPGQLLSTTALYPHRR